VPIHGYIHSGNQLCGCYNNYSPNVARISQTCDVPFQECDNPDWKCNFLKMENFQLILIWGLELSGLILDENVAWMSTNAQQYELNDCLSKLHKLSQHMHDNAFNGVWFGINPYGILGACPMDLMHAILHGLILYVIKIIISSFSTHEKHFLDLLVDEILAPICSGERSNIQEQISLKEFLI